MKILLQSATCALVLSGSSYLSASELVPAFGTPESRRFTVVAKASEGLRTPRDLAFNPDIPEHLWVVNRADDSVVIIMNPGTTAQTIDKRKDRYANHFMDEVAAFAFGARTYRNSMTFATCQESRNTYDNSAPPNNFMGPTLWPADLDLFARVHQDDPLLGSHIDMNHQSPLCMGIAHHAANQYWVFDGYNRNLVYYDFQKDHDTGHDDHSDAIIRRYTEVNLTRTPDVPSHMELDAAKKWLYIADTGAKRVIRVDVTTGAFANRLRASNEPLREYSEYKGVKQEVIAASGLQQPSGLALHEETLFVSDHATGEIIAYDTKTGKELERLATGAPGIMGLAVGPEGELWYVNGKMNTVTHIEP